MISALTWIRQGKAKSDPTPTSLSEVELENAIKELGINLKNARNEIEKDVDQIDQDLKEYNLSDYESEEESTALFGHMKGLSYYPSNNEDPYLKLEEDDTLEEAKILPTDHLIVMAKTLDEMSHLEIYIYEKEDENLYVHHDILLPSFPLALEWLDYGKNGVHGNLVAVSTFDPEIEIWDLDCLEVMLPTVVLGSSKKKKRLVHTDAVMSLAWNSNSRNNIASGSADHTIKIWDINQPKSAIHSFEKHLDKVSALNWHPSSDSVLLSGGFDSCACVFDIRTPDSNSDIFKLDSDVECLKWDPFNLSRFLVSTEGGQVYCYDARNSVSPIFQIHAHDGAVSALDINHVLSGCILTGSSDDNLLKIWNIQNNQPICITSRDLEIGRLFSAQFSIDAPYHVAVGGSKGKMAVWNLEPNPSVQAAFPSQHTQANRTLFFTEGDDASDMDDDSDDDEAVVENEL